MLTILDPDFPDQCFPPASTALDEPDGLLAVGGCLSPNRIINAYSNGIFPWFEPGSPILWWSPNPRLVLFPEQLKISRSLRKTIRRPLFDISYDQAFSAVIEACSEPRKKETGTWISSEMKFAYKQLHQLGFAHSVEAWHNGQLAGGLYGIAIGQIFFGESMFHTETDASKVAFASLVNTLKRWNYKIIDCQVQTSHLLSLGAEELIRDDFLELVKTYSKRSPGVQAWKMT